MKSVKLIFTELSYNMCTQAKENYNWLHGIWIEPQLVYVHSDMLRRSSNQLSGQNIAEDAISGKRIASLI